MDTDCHAQAHYRFRWPSALARSAPPRAWSVVVHVLGQSRQRVGSSVGFRLSCSARLVLRPCVLDLSALGFLTLVFAPPSFSELERGFFIAEIFEITVPNSVMYARGFKRRDLVINLQTRSNHYNMIKLNL